MSGAARVSLVTGAAGFVGQALVRRLLAEGDTVRALALPGDRGLDALRAEAPPGLEVVEADVTVFDRIEAAFAGVARVFHTAALVHAWAPFARFRAVNVGGTQNVARAALAHGVARFVHVSTSDVFGIPHGGETLDEGSPFRLWSEPYADSKIEGEQWLWQFHRQTGLPVSVIYPGWVYGPGDRAFFPSLATAIRGGQMLFWCRGARLAWAYIDNLVDACLMASADPVAIGNGYLVHDGADGPTLEDVCARIAAAIGASPPRRYIPYPLALGAAHVLQLVWRGLHLQSPPPLLSVDVKAFGRQFRLASEKARRQLGWEPRVSVEDGMRAAIAALSG